MTLSGTQKITNPQYDTCPDVFSRRAGTQYKLKNRAATVMER